MSRSYQFPKGRHKILISPNTCKKSEKKDKRRWNRDLRRVARLLLEIYSEEALLPTSLKEVGNIWDGAKDGKHLVMQDSEWYNKAKRK